jgi:hypothetical protein
MVFDRWIRYFLRLNLNEYYEVRLIQLVLQGIVMIAAGLKWIVQEV